MSNHATDQSAPSWSDRLWAAFDALCNPNLVQADTAANTTPSWVEMREEQVREAFQSEMAEAFRHFDAPDTAHEETGLIQPETAEDLADAVRDQCEAVPEEAVISRVTLDAVNEVRVYFDTPGAQEPDPDPDSGSASGGGEA